MSRIKNKFIEVTTDFDLANNKLTNLAAPVNPSDAVDLATLDARVQGFSQKEPCLYKTTSDFGDFNLAGDVQAALDRLGGVDPILVSGDRVLVTEQPDPIENGIYEWTGTALVRAADANDSGDLKGGSAVFVTAGDTMADKGFVLTDPNRDVNIGTDEIYWAQYTAFAQIGAGNGLTNNGGNLDVNVAATGGLEIQSDNVQVKLDGDSLATGSSGLKAAVPTTQDKARNPTANISANFGDTGLVISNTPAGDGYVGVVVSGVPQVLLGNRNGDAYFSIDGGTTARALADITAGDPLYFNATIAGFSLETSDWVDLHYNAV